MKKGWKALTVATLTAAMMAQAVIPVLAAEAAAERLKEINPKTAVSLGYWSDQNNLIWTFYDTGETYTVGRGPTYAEQHPEVTDPEFLLKRYIAYPGEDGNTINDLGETKRAVDDNVRVELQKFVNSFDWIHSDELTRAKKVYERIAHGQYGNTYDSQMGLANGNAGRHFRVITEGKGVCENFSREYAFLCKIVGIESIQYGSYTSHADDLVKINGTWLAINPTGGATFYDNGCLFPVDYDTEYNRANNEFYASEEGQKQLARVKAVKDYEAGLISREELDRITLKLDHPDWSDEEIDKWL